MPAEDITVYAKWQMKTSGDELTGIRNQSELQAIQNNPDGNFYLENDVTLDDKWTRLTNFGGRIDGRNNCIFLNFETANSSNIGLIELNNGEVFNLRLDVNLTATRIDAQTYPEYGFVATKNEGKIENIVASGSLDLNLYSRESRSDGALYKYVGAIVGISNGSMNDITSNIDITVSSLNSRKSGATSYYVHVGGIVGKATKLNSCSASASLDVESYGYNSSGYKFALSSSVGGVVCDGVDLYECSFDGFINGSGDSYCGGLAYSATEKIEKCYAKSSLRGEYLSAAGLILNAKQSTQILNCYAVNDFYFAGYYTAKDLNKSANFVLEDYKCKVERCFVYNYRLSCGNVTFTNMNLNGTIVFNEEPNYYNVAHDLEWNSSEWVLGYGTPKFFTNEYVTISYQNVPQEVINYNPSAYKKGSAGFELTSPERIGYTFDGWFDSVDYTKKITSIVSIETPMTLYAKWTPNNYTVTLNTVGGEVSGNMATVTFDSDYALEVPTRIGYTFVGWYDGTGNSAVAYTDANGKSLGKWNLTDGKTLYAKWQKEDGI